MTSHDDTPDTRDPLRGKVAPLQVHAIWRKDAREPLMRTLLDAAAETAEAWRESRAPRPFAKLAPATAA